MRTITLANLRTRIRSRANQESISLITDSELNDLINESYAEYCEILGEADTGFFEAEANITATGVAGGKYTLESDFAAVKSVERLDGDVYVRLKPIATQERGRYEATGTATRYRLCGPASEASPSPRIELIPAPPSGEVYRVTYTRAARTLSADADVIDGVNGWEAWIVYDVARKCAEKEESQMAQWFEARRAEVEERIRRAARQRNHEDPGYVVDHDGYEEPLPGARTSGMVD